MARPLTKQEIILVAFLAIAALGGGFYQFILSPTMARAQKVQSEVSAMEARIEQIRKELRDQDELERKYAQAQSDLIAFEALIPNDKEIPDLLRELESIAARCNVELPSINASNLINRNTHFEISLGLSIEGDYRNVLRFFKEFTSAKRLIIVRSTSINPSANEYQVSIQAATFTRGEAF